MDGMLELAAIVLAVLLPTVPVVIFLGRALRRSRPVGGHEVVGGRRSDTPFVLIGWVGMVVGVVALVAVMLTLAARALG